MRFSMAKCGGDDFQRALIDQHLGFLSVSFFLATVYQSTRDHQWAAKHDPLFLANGAGVEIRVSGLAQANRQRAALGATGSASAGGDECRC